MTCVRIVYFVAVIEEEFEDIKRVIRIRKSKKNRQYNGQIFWVPCCDVRYIFLIKRCSVRLYLKFFAYVICVCFCIVVSNTYCVVIFVLVVFVLCTQMLPFFLDCLVYPMLPVFLDCPFLIDPSVFSKVYMLLWRCSSNI